jgi:Trypsin-like peptidase domain
MMAGLRPDPRRYAIGERRRLRLPSDRFRTVVFLVDDGVPRIPRATGFFVGTTEDGVICPYVVTARHCVEETEGREFFIRINSGDQYEDLSTRADDWFLHDSADVALAYFAPESGSYSPVLEHVERFVSANFDVSISEMLAGFQIIAGEVTPAGTIEPGDRAKVEVGHEVAFVGLLYEQPGETKNLPIARFGHVSRMPEEPIVMRRPDDSLAQIMAYLVECHSWGGTSGSPCYWLHPAQQLVQVPDPRPDRKDTTLIRHDREIIALLGLVSGHVNIMQEARTKGDVLGEIRTAINSGIAVVTPAAAIRELYVRDDVTSDRKRRVAQARESRDRQRAITPDRAVVSTEFAPSSQNESLVTEGLANAKPSKTN